MGICFVFEEVPESENTSLHDFFLDLQLVAAARSGHQEGQSCDWNCIQNFKIINKEFNSVRNAIYWMGHELQKGFAVAVKIPAEPIKIPASMEIKLLKLKAEVDRTSKNKRQFIQNLRLKKTDAKGLTKCEECRSKINMKRLQFKTIDCPICQDLNSFVSKSDRSRLGKLTAVYAKAYKDWADLKLKIKNILPPKDCVYRWVIGGFAPCKRNVFM